MARKKIALNTNTFSNAEIDKAVQVLRSGHFTMGEECRAFEQEFAEYVGAKHAIMVNSGSSANLLAFFALANPLLATMLPDYRSLQGAEVIVPALTWSTTIWPIVQAGAIPVFVDSDPYTLQMDVAQVEKAISDNTVAICVAHILGNMVDVERLLDVARANHCWLIEDTCEALGAKCQGAMAGTIGDVGTYSFFFSHHITTIEGGMVVTQSDALNDVMRAMRAHGWIREMDSRAQYAQRYPEFDERFLFITTGFNLRPTEINAALGRVQLQRLEDFIRARNRVAGIWQDAFSSLAADRLLNPMQITPGTKPAWFGFPVLCDDQARRDALKAHLEAKGIETRPIICGNITRQPAMRTIDYKISGDLKGCDTIMAQGLYWGSHPAMQDDEIAYVTEIVREFFCQ